MVKHTSVAAVSALVVSALVAVAAAAAEAPTARAMYADALARERAVRAALDDPKATDVVLRAVRDAIASYEAVVRHFPVSGYGDNALWQAGRLALDAFARFNQPREKAAGERLLRKLVAMYPTSKLAKQVPVADLETSAAVSESALSTPSQSASAAAAPSTLTTIRNIRRAVLPDAVRVIIELDGEVPFRQERLDDPSRIFVDLPGTRPAPTLQERTLRFDGDTDVVHQVRIGRHPNNTTRIVLDAIAVSSYSVYPLYDPYRLVIDCVPATGGTLTAAAAPPAAAAPAPRRDPAPQQLPARAPATPAIRSAPANVPQHGVLLAEAHSSAADGPRSAPAADPAPPTARPAEAPAAPVAAPPVRNSTGGLSIARQLGLGVSRIVIDAGHGGHDPGAKGKGLTEAELVLDVAIRLEKLLSGVPGVDVILTRRTDEFIQLPERTAIANREGADLFLSIHANASTSAQARGIETYFLNFASNLSAAALAARENASSTQAMGALPDFVKAIALNNKLDESRDFATAVQHAMIEKLRPANKTIRDLGVKQAPFVVLIGAAMPSVLAEISFVTNPQEARLAKSHAYRQKIAEALFEAIRKYQTSLKKATAVATQR